MVEHKSQSKSAAPMVTASAVKSAPMTHRFKSMRVEPAANGYTLHVEHMPKDSGKNDGMDSQFMSGKMESHVFAGKDHRKMFKTMGEMMGVGAMGGNESGEEKPKVTAKADGGSGKMGKDDTKDMGKNDQDGDEAED